VAWRGVAWLGTFRLTDLCLYRYMLILCLLQGSLNGSSCLLGVCDIIAGLLYLESVFGITAAKVTDRSISVCQLFGMVLILLQRVLDLRFQQLIV